MARPQIKIDREKLTNLAKNGAKNTDIAAFFGVNEGTLRKRFKRELLAARAERRLAIRQAQTKSALEGNVTMQIWLGKVELKQRERAELDITSGGKPIKAFLDVDDGDGDSGTTR